MPSLFMAVMLFKCTLHSRWQTLYAPPKPHLRRGQVLPYKREDLKKLVCCQSWILHVVMPSLAFLPWIGSNPPLSVFYLNHQVEVTTKNEKTYHLIHNFKSFFNRWRQQGLWVLQLMFNRPCVMLGHWRFPSSTPPSRLLGFFSWTNMLFNLSSLSRGMKYTNHQDFLCAFLHHSGFQHPWDTNFFPKHFCRLAGSGQRKWAVLHYFFFHFKLKSFGFYFCETALSGWQ